MKKKYFFFSLIFLTSLTVFPSSSCRWLKKIFYCCRQKHHLVYEHVSSGNEYQSFRLLSDDKENYKSTDDSTEQKIKVNNLQAHRLSSDAEPIVINYIHPEGDIPSTETEGFHSAQDEPEGPIKIQLPPETEQLSLSSSKDY